MFSQISGQFVERRHESVVLNVHGLGYEIVLPPCIAAKVDASAGADVGLEIYAVLNMDGNSGRFTYYGFTNAVEREFFEALLSVASIGPRSAARAFSQPMAAIAGAIDRGDHAALRALPGIGPQKARDIVAKLQGKVTRFLLIREADPAVPVAMPDFAEEALAVLLQLGYKRSEADAMIRDALDGDAVAHDAEALLADIYRRKAKAGPHV